MSCRWQLTAGDSSISLFCGARSVCAGHTALLEFRRPCTEGFRFWKVRDEAGLMLCTVVVTPCLRLHLDGDRGSGPADGHTARCPAGLW
jgi:hypothetical protein